MLAPLAFDVQLFFLSRTSLRSKSKTCIQTSCVRHLLNPTSLEDESFFLNRAAEIRVRLRLLFTQPLKLTYPNSTLAALAQQVGLRTMTPFGFGEYLRASLYNSVPVEYAQELAGFMTQFAAEHRHLKTLAEFEKAVERQQHLQILTHQQQPPIQRRMQSPRRQQQAMHFYTAADATEP